MKKFFITIIILFFLAVGTWILFTAISSKNYQQTLETIKLPATPTPTSSGSSNQSPVNNSVGERVFTMQEVSSHNNAQSCYGVINGSVYDLTSYINLHPGGPTRILSICGIDGTSVFESQHGGQSAPQNILSSMKIGVLGS
jgi:cytochrome b involved in lipid metabolism